MPRRTTWQSDQQLPERIHRQYTAFASTLTSAPVAIVCLTSLEIRCCKGTAGMELEWTTQAENIGEAFLDCHYDLHSVVS